MLITVTLNPAVDKTAYLENFSSGSVNRVKEVRKDAGGKGINVSKVAAKLGGTTAALGFLGGSAGEFISEEITQFDIEQDFVWLAGETRTNLKIVDTVSGVETEVNEPGAKVSDAELAKLEEKIMKVVGPDDSVILTGSLPPGVADDIYARLIDDLSSTDTKVFLDASDNSLEQGINSVPFLVKPNLAELESLLDQQLETTEEIIKAAQKLQDQGIEIVVISLGSEGSLVVAQENCFKVIPPKVKASSTIGAGDTLVGALALKLEAGSSLKEAMQYATAASANSVTKAGTQLCEQNEVEELLSEVEIVDL